MAKQPTPTVTKKHLARMERERIQRRNLLIGVGVVLGLVFVILIFGIIDQTVLLRARPVAKVGNDTITTGEFQGQVRYTRKQLIDQLSYFMSDPLYQQFFGSYIQQIQTQLADPTTLGRQVLDRMIEDRIIAQEAEALGITVSEEELNAAIEEQFGFFENGTPTPAPSPTAYSTSTLSPTQLALVPPTATATATAEVTETPAATATATEVAATATPVETSAAGETPPAPEATSTPAGTPTPFPTPTEYTREGFEAAYKQYLETLRDVNLSGEDLREIIRADLLRQKLFDEITKDIETSVEQVWARHILVGTQKEAEMVIERLNAGEDFAKLAAEFSTDESNKDNGGDLGWFTYETMVEEFSNVAFGLKVGEISGAVPSSFGYHVIQVLGHETRPLDAGQLNQAKQTAFNDWLALKKTEKQVETFNRWMEVVPEEPRVPLELTAGL